MNTKMFPWYAVIHSWDVDYLIENYAIFEWRDSLTSSSSAENFFSECMFKDF
jgi:hypothetical protein